MLNSLCLLLEHFLKQLLSLVCCVLINDITSIIISRYEANKDRMHSNAYILAEIFMLIYIKYSKEFLSLW